MVEIKLRKYRNDDAKTFAKFDCSPKEHQIEFTINDVTAEEFKRGYKILRVSGYKIYSVIKKEKGKHNKVIGIVIFRPDGDPENQRYHIEYYLDKPFQNQGYGTLIVKQMVKLAMYKLDINKLIAEPYIKNMRSRKVLEKNGFRKVGIRRQHEPQIWIKDIFDDVVLYEYIREKD